MFCPTSGQATHLGQRNKLTQELRRERQRKWFHVFMQKYLWSKAVNPGGRAAIKHNMVTSWRQSYWTPLHISEITLVRDYNHLISCHNLWPAFELGHDNLEGNHYHGRNFWQNCSWPESRSGPEWWSHNWAAISHWAFVWLPLSYVG